MKKNIQQQIILINGPPAAGKSTTCKALCKEMPTTTFIDIEPIKEKCSHLPRVEKKKQAANEFWPQVQEAINSNKKYILLQETTRKQLKKFCDTKTYCIISFFLQTPLITTKERNNKRKKTLSEEYMNKSYEYLSTPEAEDIILNSKKQNQKEIVNLILEKTNPTK